MDMNKAETATSAASGQELRGAEILVKALQAENVQYIWGYPGGAVLHIYDAFYKQDTIQHVLVRHEQAAVHAADTGTARRSHGGSRPAGNRRVLTPTSHGRRRLRSTFSAGRGRRGTKPSRGSRSGLNSGKRWTRTSPGRGGSCGHRNAANA